MAIAAIVNASISSTTLTINSVISGTVAANTFLYGTGLTTNTVIVSGSGTTWTVSVPQTVTNITASVATLGITDYGISGVQVTDTVGGFSCNSTTLYVGMVVTVYGVLGGTGSITGYNSGAQYVIYQTNGSTTFSLATMTGTIIVTSVGTITGLTFSVDGSILSSNNFNIFKSRSTILRPALLRVPSTKYVSNNIFDTLSPISSGNTIFKSRSTILPPLGRIITANSTTANALLRASTTLPLSRLFLSNTSYSPFILKSRSTVFRPTLIVTDKTKFTNSALTDSYLGSTGNTINSTIFRSRIPSPARSTVITTSAVTAGSNVNINTPIQIWTTGT